MCDDARNFTVALIRRMRNLVNAGLGSPVEGATIGSPRKLARERSRDRAIDLAATTACM